MTITMEFPEQLIEELEVIPKTGYYTSTSEFLKDAIKTILSARKDLMVSIAVELYKKDYSVGTDDPTTSTHASMSRMRKRSRAIL